MVREMKKRSFWENFITLMIILVLIQTFLEEISVLLDWPLVLRNGLIVSGFFFDLLFSLEFLIRLINSPSRKGKRYYMKREGGWVDLISSIPLLIFSSGPGLLALVLGINIQAFSGILGILKVVKAVRIARILRFLRVLKIFRHIKNTDSPMGQRHITRISTIAISAVIMGSFISSLIIGFSGYPDGIDRLFEKQETEAEMLGFLEPQELSKLSNNMEDLLLIKQGEKTLYTLYDQTDYDRYFGINDYRVIETDEYTYFFSLKEAASLQSLNNLILFVSVLILLGGILLFYNPHFALTVTDPIHVMKRGFSEKGYNLAVKILPEYYDDDIFKLAREYNEEYLSMKDRERIKETDSVISLDLKDFEDML